MNWLPPADNHIIYEALTVIADRRAEFVSENLLHCTSSSKGKFYTVSYEPSTGAIMSNDNTAYYVGRVSYPMVVMLILKGKLTYSEKILEMLEGIVWKDFNQMFKNDYLKAVDYVLAEKAKQGVDVEYIKREVEKIFQALLKIEIPILGPKQRPPQGY